MVFFYFAYQKGSLLTKTPPNLLFVYGIILTKAKSAGAKQWGTGKSARMFIRSRLEVRQSQIFAAILRPEQPIFPTISSPYLRPSPSAWHQKAKLSNANKGD